MILVFVWGEVGFGVCFYFLAVQVYDSMILVVLGIVRVCVRWFCDSALRVFRVGVRRNFVGTLVLNSFV